MNHRKSDSNLTSRRTLLRGVGVAMALPWMESLAVWGGEQESAEQGPKRLATLFMANGINPLHWHAEGAGEDMKLGKCLEPFENLKSKINVISGLYNQASLGVGIHPGQTGNLLSGASLKRGSELGGGISMDQVLANHIGRETIQSSLVLGCEQPVTGYHETNFSMAYSSHISWQNETSPVPMETYPALAFDSLFENRGMARNKSILDRVQEDAQSLARKISSSDQQKLDEYLNSVREVEQKIERIRKASNKAAERAKDRGRPLITMDRPDNGLPEDIREHMRLMCDIIAMAFQTDKTRVATMMLNIDISGMIYPFLGIRYGHHGASHNDRSDDYMRIVQYHCSQAAYLAEKLQSMPEGDSNVLDNSIVMFISNMWSGSKHESSRVPVVQIGGLGGELETGRVMDFTKAGDDNRRLCSLYLSIMHKMGLPLGRFGDSDQQLAGL
ncbi:MAG: DUF1552 domain-containing protein [Planctomycetota bacterium]